MTIENVKQFELDSLRAIYIDMQDNYSQTRSVCQSLGQYIGETEKEIVNLQDQAKAIYGKIILGRLGPFMVMLLLFLIICASSGFTLFSPTVTILFAFMIGAFSKVLDEIVQEYKKRHLIVLNYEKKHMEILDMINSLNIVLEESKLDMENLKQKLKYLKRGIDEVVGKINICSSEIRMLSMGDEGLQPQMEIVPVIVHGNKLIISSQ